MSKKIYTPATRERNLIAIAYYIAKYESSHEPVVQTAEDLNKMVQHIYRYAVTHKVEEIQAVWDYIKMIQKDTDIKDGWEFEERD